MDLKRPSYQRTVRWTMQGLTEPFLKYHWRKVVRCVQFTGKGVISQKPTEACKKTLRQALEYVKNCRSGLSLVALGCSAGQFWFKSLQSLTVHDRQFLQGNLFLLAVFTHDVGLYLCSIFCTRSPLQFSAASYRAFGARNTPQLYPITLIIARPHASLITSFQPLLSDPLP